LETPSGRVFTVEAAKLSAADQALLRQHFAEAPAAPVELSQPSGTVTGPIEAGSSHYHLYLPKSLRSGRKAPLLFFTHSGGGNAGRMKPLLEGAEICGWIVAMSVESKNGMEKEESVVHSKRCVDHLLKTLPVDSKRVYFSGTSGGSREAFYNSSQMDSAGVLAIIAGAQPEELSRSKHYFFISGASDFNRYGTAHSYAAVKSSSAFRFHPGRHADGPGWLVTEGMMWLETKWGQKAKESGAAREAFESAALSWAEGLKSREPWRAAWWAGHLLESGLQPASRARAEALLKEAGAAPEAAAYAKGLADLEKFAENVLAEGPIYSPDCFDHTSPDIQKKADRLLEVHAATPWVKEILAGLKEKTDKN
jgi:hypothetical protein